MSEETFDVYRRLRAARNRSMYREINERARAAVAPFGVPLPPIAHAFVCECGRPDCGEYIELELPEYEHVRDGIDRLAVLPEHALEGERVLERNERYVIVEPAPVGVPA